jgi:hypothetical protein
MALILLDFRIGSGAEDGFVYEVGLGRWGLAFSFREVGQASLAVDEGETGRDKVFLGAPVTPGILPDLGLGSVEAAELPVGGYQEIHQEALFAGGGLEEVIVFESEGFQDGGIFAGDDVGLSVDAGFEGIEPGNGLAFDGTGAGGFLRIEAVRLDLKEFSHNFCFEGSRRGGWWRVVGMRKCFGVNGLRILKRL